MAGKGNGKAPLVAERRGGGTRKPAAPARKAAPRRPSPRRGGILGALAALVRWVLRLVWGAVWRATAVVALILAGATWFFHAQLPDLSALLDGRQRGSVTMLDQEGDVFAWRGESFAGGVRAADVSANLRNAVIATEDRRFYSHFGISPRGIAGAIRINLSEGRGAFQGNGGSTLTQQVAKLLCLGVPLMPPPGRPKRPTRQTAAAGRWCES